MELKVIPRPWLTSYLSNLTNNHSSVAILDVRPSETSPTSGHGESSSTGSMTRSLLIDLRASVQEPHNLRHSGPAVAVKPTLHEKLLARARTIGEMTDAVVRNLHITESYRQLSIELSRVLGSTDANWCTFAKWASARAGRTIRKEDLLSIRPAAHMARPGVGILVDVALSQASIAVARGNRKVYLELAPVLAGFVELCDGQTQPDLAALDSFLARATRQGRSERGGQDLLKVALRNYYEAKFETSSETKVELIALANAQVGLHVQILLQPEVTGRMTPGGRLLATRALLGLRVPDATLEPDGDSLGQEDRMFPGGLQQAANADLKRILFGSERTSDASKGSGIWEWMDLADRLSSMYELFRLRQQDARLMNEDALTSEQRKRWIPVAE